MRTRLLTASNDLISDKVTLVKPQQETTEVINTLLDGSWHVQTVGDPRHSYEIEFVVPAIMQGKVDQYAARKTLLRLERHGKTHTGVIRGNPEWELIRRSHDPTRAKYGCKIVLLVVGD
jgi:hypothetical protein